MGNPQRPHFVNLELDLGCEIGDQGALVDDAGRAADEQHTRLAAADIDLGGADAVPHDATDVVRVGGNGEAVDEGVVEADCGGEIRLVVGQTEEMT